MSNHNNLERRKYARVNCSGESDLRMGRKIIHAKLVNVSMSGFSILADQKTELYNLFEGVLVIRRATGPIRFRACSVWVDCKQGTNAVHKFKIAFYFMTLDPISKQTLVSYIRSSLKGLIRIT